MTPKQVIEHIRQHEYGIGLPLDSESSPVIAKMRQKVDRALKLLSHDLYAKDIHFVLEILQNAEDNTYLPEVVPEVRLILTWRLASKRGSVAKLVQFDEQSLLQ